MNNLYTGILVAIIIAGVITSKISFGHEKNTLKLSGPLAAVPCSNHGDLEIAGEDIRVTPGQSVTCTSTGGDVRINNFTVEEGGTFNVSAFEHSHTPENEHNTQWADTSCTSGILGSSDCNVCANNVRQQFDDLFGTQAIKSESFWKLRQKTHYPPSNNRPRDVFSPGHIGRHIQGFVKTNPGAYAGTYSHKKSEKGAIFFVDYDAVNDRLILSGLHEAWNNHPSGMSVLGNYVIFGDKRDNGPNSASGRDLRVIRVSDARTVSSTSLLVDNWKTNSKNFKFNAGGGVGMVKLNSGGYLLITTSPGGPAIDTELDFEFDTFSPENPPKNTDFFYVEGKLNSPSTELAEFGSELGADAYLDMVTKHLGRWTQDQFGEGPRQSKYQYSENLTVIPECGTGDVFVIHTSSTKPWAVSQDTKPGYWRLSKVVWESSGPELDILSVHEDDQSFGGCLHRAAATAWVNPNHEMELYCSEYRMDDRREDDMHFKIRAVGNEAAL